MTGPTYCCAALRQAHADPDAPIAWDIVPQSSKEGWVLFWDDKTIDLNYCPFCGADLGAI